MQLIPASSESASASSASRNSCASLIRFVVGDLVVWRRSPYGHTGICRDTDGLICRDFAWAGNLRKLRTILAPRPPAANAKTAAAAFAGAVGTQTAWANPQPTTRPVDLTPARRCRRV